MSIFFIGMSTLSPQETKKLLDRATQSRSAILKHFWISEPSIVKSYDKDTAREYNFDAKSVFLIQWNKEEGSEFIPSIPAILYEAFGPENLLVFDLDRELVKYNR